MAQLVKNLPTMWETLVGKIPSLGRSPGEGKGYSLQYSCLENKIYNIILVSGVVVCGLIAKSCPTLAILWTVAHQPPLSGILQARIVEWFANSFSRGSS